MRYSDDKTRSAELLRLTLAQMGRHEASFNPVCFAVWYEHVAAMNPALSAAIELRQAGGQPLDDAAIYALYQAHVAAPDQAVVERIGGELQRLMHTVSQSAGEAGDQAGNFSERLVGFSAVLESADQDRLAPHLGELLIGTQAMQASVHSLQKRVSHSQTEIDRLRADLARARCEALIDPLTGVLNRKGFDQQLEALIRQRPPGCCHGLVMLDLDHFKHVNDTHGHLVGDQVIQAMGEVLRSTVTQAGHAAARYGGEEFAIILPNSSLAECTEVAERVRRRTKAIKFRHRGSHEVVLSVTVSGGVAALRDDDDAAALIARADAALYVSKNAGRDRVTCA